MLTRSGDDLFSMAVGSTREAQSLAETLRSGGAWLEVVPGIDSVAVRFDAAVISATDARSRIEAILRDGIPPLDIDDELIEIPVTYGGVDGPDFDDVCAALNLSGEELIALHTGREYTVDMIGFTPGFAFIGGLDDRLGLPRRKEPRPHVAAGSIGIADRRTGIYAVESPGGWSLIGRTDMTLFDPTLREPFLIRAGMRVRFRASAGAGQ